MTSHFSGLITSVTQDVLLRHHALAVRVDLDMGRLARERRFIFCDQHVEIAFK